MTWRNTASLSGAQLVASSPRSFCTAVQDAGLHAMVYANGSFFSKMDLVLPERYGRWTTGTPGMPPCRTWTASTPSAARRRSRMMWQYSSSCVVQGALASGKTDINVLYMPEYLELCRAGPSTAAGTARRRAALAGAAAPTPAAYTVYRRGRRGRTRRRSGPFDGAAHRCTDEGVSCPAWDIS